MSYNDPIEFDPQVRREVADQLWKAFMFQAESIEVNYAHKTVHVTIHLKEPTGRAQGMRTYVDGWNHIREDRPDFRGS